MVKIPSFMKIKDHEEQRSWTMRNEHETRKYERAEISGSHLPRTHRNMNWTAPDRSYYSEDRSNRGGRLTGFGERTFPEDLLLKGGGDQWKEKQTTKEPDHEEITRKEYRDTSGAKAQNSWVEAAGILSNSEVLFGVICRQRDDRCKLCKVPSDQSCGYDGFCAC